MVRLLQAGLIAICRRVTAALELLAAGQRRILSPEPRSRQLRPRKPDIHQMDPATRLAIELVEKVFVRDFRWSFRRLPGLNIGIDARAEVLENGWPTCQLLPLQIRPISFLKENEGHFVYRGEKHHLDCWARHSLPVCVIVVDTETGLMLWQRIEKQLCEEVGVEWSIAIHATSLLDASARLSFEGAIPTDPESLMRAAFALDLALMEQIQDQATFLYGTSGAIRLRSFAICASTSGKARRQSRICRSIIISDLTIFTTSWSSFSPGQPIRMPNLFRNISARLRYIFWKSNCGPKRVPIWKPRVFWQQVIPRMRRQWPRNPRTSSPRKKKGSFGAAGEHLAIGTIRLAADSGLKYPLRSF